VISGLVPGEFAGPVSSSPHSVAAAPVGATVSPSAAGAAELLAAERSLPSRAGPTFLPRPVGEGAGPTALGAIRPDRSAAARPASPLGWQLLGTLESRYGGAMAYDAADGYVLEFGGDPDSGSTWTYENGTWTNVTLTVHGSPPGRAAASMTYDPPLGAIVLFGGLSFATAAGFTLNDTWEYRAGTWTNLTGTAGTPPESRYFGGLAYDANDSAAVLFGGIDNASAVVNGTWEFAGGRWSNVTANQTISPASSEAPSFAADGSGADAVLFGGGTVAAPFQNQTWTFAGNRWTNVTGTVGAAPPGRIYAGFSSDSSAGGAILFGGYGAPPAGSSVPVGFADTWQFSSGAGARWSRVATGPSAPAPRLFESMSDDPPAGGVVLYGGFDQFNETTYGDTWGYAAGNWTLAGTSATPTPRDAPTMAYDSTSHQVILFGGSGLNDTWSYSAGNWTRLAPTRSPGGRIYATLTDDPSDGELVLFGGERLIRAAPNAVLLNDTWVFANGTWTNITGTARGPSGPIGATSAYDSTAGVVVLFGGENETAVQNETWTFHAGRWTQVDVGGTAPSPRNGAAIADDPYDSGVVLFGGVGCNAPADLALLCNDTWTFSADTWTKQPTTNAPSVRDFAGLVDDPAFGADVLVGGLGFPCLVTTNETLCTEVLENDTWAYRGGVWTNLTGAVGLPPEGGLGAAFVEDSTAGYAFLFGAYAVGSGDAGASWWSLSPGASTPVVVGAPRASANPVAVGNLTNLSVQVSGGVAPYELSWSGLPSGCASANSTTLACRPSAAGAFSVRVSASDSEGDMGKSPLLFLNVTVLTYPVGSVTITPGAVTLNVSGSANLTAHAYDTAGHALSGASYAWSASPASLGSLNGSSGETVEVSANRTPGVLTVVVNATFEGRSALTTERITVIESTGQPFEILGILAMPSPAVVGSNLTFTTQVLGGTLPYEYEYTGLPDGCPPENAGTWTCVPTSAGEFTVTAEVTDHGGNAANVTLQLTVTRSNSGTPPVLTTPELVGVGFGVLFLAVVGGFLVARWAGRPRSSKPARPRTGAPGTTPDPTPPPPPPPSSG
jgi:Galactose oxidase, central domain